jgi:hypothetical protein
MYVVHPGVNDGKYNHRSFRVFNLAILLLSVLVIALLIVYKIQIVGA